MHAVTQRLRTSRPLGDYEQALFSNFILNSRQRTSPWWHVCRQQLQLAVSLEYILTLEVKQDGVTEALVCQLSCDWLSGIPLTFTWITLRYESSKKEKNSLIMESRYQDEVKNDVDVITNDDHRIVRQRQHRKTRPRYRMKTSATTKRLWLDIRRRYGVVNAIRPYCYTKRSKSFSLRSALMPAR